MSVVKSKYQQRPIGRKKNTLKRQLKLKIKSTNMSKARENASDHVAICFSSVSDWMKSNEDFLDQSQREVQQNQCNSGLLSTLYRKLYYYWIYRHIKIQLSDKVFWKSVNIVQHSLYFTTFSGLNRSINSLIRNTIILFRRFYTGFFPF